MTSEHDHWGLIFVLVGPPGAGKNTVMNRVLKDIPTLRQLATATTRAMRPTEQEGREHYFMGRDEFEQMLASNALLEHQIIHGEFYGILRRPVEQAIATESDIIADIDVYGAEALRTNFPGNAVLVFVEPPSREALISRMQERGEGDDEIEKRMERVDMEMSHLIDCDYLITNCDADDASALLAAIVRAERSKREVRKRRAEKLAEQLA
ncbi:MAG: guanylate kinase [Anaerolineae bacterium]|nr:guanylate kinase [Anaerolineae bacterium]